jgi:hypothetical protein
MFTMLPDFDRGANFNHFNAYNNLRNVLIEYENYYRYGMEARPLIETQFE